MSRASKLTEKELIEIGKEKNLKLISNYSEYQNIKSLLQWECLNCGTKFSSKVVLVKQNICPCPECRKHRKRSPRFNLDTYKEGLNYYINKYINILVKNPKFKSYISNNIKNEVLILFNDVINSFNSRTENDKFLNFYKRMGEKNAKGPKYLAIALIYFIFKKKDDTLTQPEINSVLNIGHGGVSVAISRLLDIIKLIPNYEFTLSFIKPKNLDLHEYSQEIIKYLKIYTKSLSKIADLEKIRNNELKDIVKIFINSVNLIQKPNKLKEYLNFFKRISPSLHTSIILYIYMKYKKDIDIDKILFIKILNSNHTKEYIHNSSFIETLKIFLNKFFKFDEDNYRKKVRQYLNQFIIKLENWEYDNNNISNEISEWLINNNFILLQELIKSLSQTIINNAMNLYSKIIENGFKIIYIPLQIRYFYPQYMALSLLYYTFKSDSKLEILASPTFFIIIFGNTDKYKQYINSINRPKARNNRLLSYIRKITGHLSKQHYQREDFIQLLKKNLEKHYHLETEFFLNLYLLTILTPNEFGEKLGIYGTSSLGGILSIVKNQTTISEPQVFRSIKLFIKNFIQISHQSEFLIWINNIEDLNQKDFNHQGVNYRFQWNQKRLQTIMNLELRRIIYSFITSIWENEFPQDIFLSKTNFRASNFNFRGSKIQPIHTNMILNYFQDKLKLYDQTHSLSEYVVEVVKRFHKKRFGKKPDHNPVLQHTLLECKEAIATEIPVWMEIPNSNQFYVGHIDLLLIYDNSIIIADFKQSKAKILKNIPQLMTYAFLLKHQLSLIGNVNTLNIKCIGYTKNIAFEFNPFDIKGDVLNFINQHSILKEKLLPKYNSLLI